MAISTLHDQASIHTDFSGLHKLRNKARSNDPEALKVAAQQFEGIMMNMMLKSMRAANEIFREDSLFSSKEVKFYEDMLDQQMSSTLSKRGQLGIADILIRQLSPQINNKKTHPNMELNRSVEVSKHDPVSNQSKFLEQLLQIANEAVGDTGLDPKLLISQAALETGWGEYPITDSKGAQSHNYFGIKSGQSWRGESVNTETTEFIDGHPIRKVDRFRQYESIEAGMKDYLQLISTTPRYEEAWRHRQSPERYSVELQKAGYATDPEYANKILKIYESID